MNEALVRERMDKLEIKSSSAFLVRAMEAGTPFALDNQMLECSRGAVVCLDTMGYFNQGDDIANYKESIKFGEMCFRLMTEGGALAVIALTHPPKNTANQNTMSLENMVIGSAGYGGLLRSCLGIRNLNTDLNDPKLHVYVQGLKNPGLRPFQLKGIPLGMFNRQSPYLDAISRNFTGKNDDPKKSNREKRVHELHEKGKSYREIVESIGDISINTVMRIVKGQN